MTRNFLPIIVLLLCGVLDLVDADFGAGALEYAISSSMELLTRMSRFDSA